MKKFKVEFVVVTDNDWKPNEVKDVIKDYLAMAAEETDDSEYMGSAEFKRINKYKVSEVV